MVCWKAKERRRVEHARAARRARNASKSRRWRFSSALRACLSTLPICSLMTHATANLASMSLTRTKTWLRHLCIQSQSKEEVTTIKNSKSRSKILFCTWKETNPITEQEWRHSSNRIAYSVCYQRLNNTPQSKLISGISCRWRVTRTSTAK